MRVLPTLPPALTRNAINPRDLKQYLLEVEDSLKDTLVSTPDIDHMRQLQGMVIALRELRTKLNV